MREQELINRTQQAKIDIEQLRYEADKAEQSGDYGRVAEIRYGLLKDKEREIAQVQDELRQAQGEGALTLAEGFLKGNPPSGDLAIPFTSITADNIAQMK